MSSGDLEGTSSEDLLALIASGHGPAFAVLHRRVQPHVMATARALLRDTDLAQEVTQEVLLHLWQHASSFNPDRGTAAGWIYGLARSRAIDRIRAWQAARIRDHQWASQTKILHRPILEPDQAVLAELQATELHAALSTISPRQRQAILLAFFGGHTHPQIAAALHLPLGTVKTRIRDGLLRMRAQLGEQPKLQRHPARTRPETGSSEPARDHAA